MLNVWDYHEKVVDLASSEPPGGRGWWRLVPKTIDRTREYKVTLTTLVRFIQNIDGSPVSKLPIRISAAVPAEQIPARSPDLGVT
jgi:hypothetical protein